MSEYPHKHKGDKCMKCGGYLNKPVWIPHYNFAARFCPDTCPHDEHLHLLCECGYWVWEKTAEQHQLDRDAKLSR